MPGLPNPVFQRILTLLMPKGITLGRRHIGELSWLVGGQLGTLLLSLLTIKIITSVGPDDYGLFVLATSVSGLFLSGFFGPLEQGFVRKYFEYIFDPGTRYKYLGTITNILGYSIGILAVILVVAAVVAGSVTGLDARFLIPAAFLILTAVPSAPLAGMLNAMRLRKEVAIAQIGEKMMTLVLLAGLLMFNAVRIPEVMICIAVSGAIWFAVRYTLYHRAVDSPISRARDAVTAGQKREMIGRISSYSLPFVAWGLVAWMQINGERWVIGGMLTTADVGRYGLASTLINSSVVVAVSVVGQYLTPIIFEKFSSSEPTSRSLAFSVVRRAAILTFAMFCALGVALLLVGDVLIHLISTTDFILEPELLFLLSVGWGMFYSGQMMTNVGLGLQQPNIYILPKIITSILSVAGYILGCLLAGIYGLVVSLALVNTLYLVWILLVNRTLRSSDTQPGS
ncbi:MAG: hypothetical protein HY563_01525 [Ignavibacteriales bacterium]|nr:hypothetical protein [Ignavibacteriales bacterium]